MDRRGLERALADVEAFEAPRADLEQYPTPPAVAASLLHRAWLDGAVEGRTVVDLGAGTGTLALGAALLGAERSVGLERDPAALRAARSNGDRLGPPKPVAWVLGDVRNTPLCLGEATVVMNPPFGAQAASAGDRPFLSAAAAIADVSYSIHNADSRHFVEAFAADHGGRVTGAFVVDLDLDRQFAFHADDRRSIGAEAYRIDWASAPG